jgi:hypothetical protein
MLREIDAKVPVDLAAGHGSVDGGRIREEVPETRSELPAQKERERSAHLAV